MDTSMAMTRIEAALEQQVLVAGGDAEVEAAAAALLAALGPAVGQIALDLAEQAAAEVGAQLPGKEVAVVLADGEPTLEVRTGSDTDAPGPGEALDARITLRLSPTLKERVEGAAEVKGESVNSWLIKALAAQAVSRSSAGARRVTGTIET